MSNDRYYTVKEVKTAKAFRKVFTSQRFKNVMNDKFLDLLIFGLSTMHEDEMNGFKKEFEMEIQK